jgi:uncharacterized protein
MSNGSAPDILLTVPEEIASDEVLMLTGNEYLSLPHINPGGGIEAINIIHLQHRGLLQFDGAGEKALIEPLIEIDQRPVDLATAARWHYVHDWLPSFSAGGDDSWNLEGEIITPPGQRGFCYRLTLTNKTEQAIKARLGWTGVWQGFSYIIFKKRSIDGKNYVFYDKWSKSLVLEASAGLPLAALAMATTPGQTWTINETGNQYETAYEFVLNAGESNETILYVAVNLEADGAATTSVDLRRQGYEILKQLAVGWLEDHLPTRNDFELTGLLNRNLLFSYYYALGRSIDSNQLVAITSRSPRYYVSAAFWSRDSLLWSFPAVMLLNRDTARELLLTAFDRHITFAGDHAHYINGTVLYPGFELDQLAAYLIALRHYLCSGGDQDILKESIIRKGMEIIVEKTFEQFVPEHGLFKTFLDPSDDPVTYPYLTYNNALLQCGFSFLGSLQAEERWFHRSDFQILAAELRQTIYEYCIIKGPLGLMFAWAVDGNGRFSLYDNPPGSLQLLAHYGFCDCNDTVFKTTVRWIRSANNKYFHLGSAFEEAGSLHAGKPWPLAACNDLLAYNTSALDFFSRAEMDNGFFCETVNPDTGKVSTGAAFASAAGFMAYALDIIRSQ